MASPLTNVTESDFPCYASVTVKAPGSSANFGPGFDSVGIALDVWVQLKVSVSGDGWRLLDGGDECTHEETIKANFIVKHFLYALEEYLGLPSCTQFRFEISNDIPIGKGLGSSASAIVVAVAAAFLMAGIPMDSLASEVGTLASRIEGHPDNALPSAHGGLIVGLMDANKNVLHQKLALPELAFLVHIPKNPVKTEYARSILPEEYTRATCSRNIAKTALLIASLLNGDHSMLKAAMEDEIHEPYRKELCPEFKLLKEFAHSAEATGVLGVYLSGAGPCTVVLCNKNEAATVSAFVKQKYPELVREGDLRAMLPTAQGLVVVETLIN